VGAIFGVGISISNIALALRTSANFRFDFDFLAADRCSGRPLRRVYAPLLLYERSDLPGSVEFFSLAIWLQYGGEISLPESREFAIEARDGE
jgi:hypothetical protein